MRKTSYVLLGFTMLIALAAAPVCAQSSGVVTKVPFEFVVGSTTLPAGGYAFDTKLAEGVARISSVELHRNVMVMFQPGSLPSGAERGEATLVFHRHGNTYFLSEVRNGYVSEECLIPTSKMEEKLEKNAALHMPDEAVVVLASLQ